MQNEHLGGRPRGTESGHRHDHLPGLQAGRNECASKGETAGTIETSPLESFIEDEGEGKADTEVYPEPIMAFTCGSEKYALQGGFRGETTGVIDTMSLTSESVFNQGVGEQELQTVAHAKEKEPRKTIMTLSYKLTGEQAMEINTNPRGAG